MLNTLSIVQKLVLVFIAASHLAIQANTITSEQNTSTVLNFFKKANYNASMSAFRGFDEFSRTGYSLGFGASYKLNSEVAASISSSFSIASDLKASNPEYYGLNNISLSLRKSDLFELSFIDSVNGSLGVTLPTSEVSRFTQFRGSLNVGMGLSNSYDTVLGKLSTSYGVSLKYANYKYDSAVYGYGGKNSPFGFSNRLGLSLGVTDQFSLSTGISVYNRYDYDWNHDLIQSLSTSAAYAITKSLSTSVSYNWSDKFYSNDDFLDDDKTNFSLTLGYSF